MFATFIVSELETQKPHVSSTIKAILALRPFAETSKLLVNPLLRHLMSSIQEVRPHILPKLASKLGVHAVGSRPLHSLICLEFVKSLDEFTLLEKAQIMAHLATVDIDASAIIKSAHRVLKSTLTARKTDDFPEGLFDTQQ